MAPEQAENAKAAGPPADVFAMGATIYAMLTGGPPFRGSSLVAVIRSAMEDDAPPLPDEVGAGLRQVIDKCLAKNPAARFRDASELLAALVRVHKNPNATMAERRPIAPTPLPPGSRKSRAPAIFGVGALVLLAGGIVAMVVKNRGTKKEPETVVDEDKKPPGEDVEALFAQADRLEKANRFDDALATLTRIAAFAPDDSRLRDARLRIEARVKANRDAAAKSEAYRGYLPLAEVARTKADQEDTPELWDKALDAIALLEGSAQSDGEKAKSKEMREDAEQRLGWSKARVEEKAGRLQQALELAKSALAPGPENEFLSSYIRGLEKKIAEVGQNSAAKKDFEEAFKNAESEKDASKARALWEKAIKLAPDKADKERAEAKLAEVLSRLAGTERETLYAEAMADGRAAMDAGDLDEAERCFRAALALQQGDELADQQLRSVLEKQEAKLWRTALDELEAAKKGDDLEALKAAYRKALALRKDASLERELAELDAKKALIRPAVTDREVSLFVDEAKTIPMKFARLKAGTFRMGTGGEARTVKLTKDFAVGVTEVTQDQWRALMPMPPVLNAGGSRPVEAVSWHQAMEYAERLNQRLSGWRVVLPTSAQWEYACRAGSKSEWGPAKSEGELDEYAWTARNSEGRSHDVATRKPNAWGLYDMQGNVAEWTWDWYAPVPADKELTDPVGPGGAVEKVNRGGGFLQTPDNSAAAKLGINKPTASHGDLGFRLILLQGEEGNPQVRRFTLPLDDVKKLKMDFVLVRAGTYTAAPPAGSLDGVPRRVTISQDFWMSTTEVTQGQFEEVLGKRNFAHKGPDLPADSITWNDAQEFVKRLATRLPKLRPSLPTEAEWEYACRADSSTAFAHGDDADAAFGWFAGGAKESQPAGRLRANIWGLYDMHGNVREWCLDWYGPTGGEAATDPKGPATGVEKVVRGGAFDLEANWMASGGRDKAAPDKRHPNVGFRVVLR
jgi:formylglycine-generating enzyme required for sulfatase activity/prefoldin subunit 5